MSKSKLILKIHNFVHERVENFTNIIFVYKEINIQLQQHQFNNVDNKVLILKSEQCALQ